MKSGIDPKIDFAFKRVFGSIENLNLLRHLLNAVMGDSVPRPIRDVQVLNPFSMKDALDDRLSILDIKARDDVGREYLVEMQMFPHASLPERLLYYGAKHYSTQLSEGDDYSVLRPIVVICFVNAVLFPHAANYHGRFELTDIRQEVRFSDHLTIHLVEIPKFLRQLEQLEDDLERWTYFLRYGNDLDAELLPSPLAIPEIAQAAGTLTMLSMNDAERDLYEARLKFRRDEAARTAYALNEGFEKGVAQGRAVGLEQGLELGRDEGREIGRHEGQAEGIRFALLRVGELRFGPASEPTREKLRGIASIEQLEQLTARILTISGWNELFGDNTPA